MGVLADTDTTLKNSDISLIKNKLFINLYNLRRSHSDDNCIAFSFYELKYLDLNMAEIELLLQHGVCRSHAIFNEIYPLCNITIKFVSDFDTCKRYMCDPAEFYKQYDIEVDKFSDWERATLTSDYIEQKVLSCMLLFDIQTQQEYYTFRDVYFNKEWKTGYINNHGAGMINPHNLPLLFSTI